MLSKLVAPIIPGSFTLVSFEGVSGHIGGPRWNSRWTLVAEDGIPGDSQQEPEALSITAGILPTAGASLEADRCPVKPQMTLQTSVTPSLQPCALPSKRHSQAVPRLLIHIHCETRAALSH